MEESIPTETALEKLNSMFCLNESLQIPFRAFSQLCKFYAITDNLSCSATVLFLKSPACESDTEQCWN